MSDDFFCIIPTERTLVPPEAVHQRALDEVRALAPEAHDVKLRVHDEIAFIHAGGNWEATRCPLCNADVDEVDDSWWGEAMDQASKSRFEVLDVTMPCCGGRSTLADLHYEWPQGFARFEIEVMNPGREPFSIEELARLETALGCPVRVILQHL